jgi:hypothetical protein
MAVDVRFCGRNSNKTVHKCMGMFIDKERFLWDLFR